MERKMVAYDKNQGLSTIDRNKRCKSTHQTLFDDWKEVEIRLNAELLLAKESIE